MLTKGGGEVNIYLSEISPAEIYNILLRRKGKKTAEEVIEYT
ncbi:MAG: hypothetical protein ACQES4_08685 [Bacillota bacterium]